MIVLRNLKVALDDYKNLKKCCAIKLKTDEDNIVSLKVIRRSIDARKRQDIHFVYSFLLELKRNEQSICRNCKSAEPYVEETEEEFIPAREKSFSPVIVGSGPAGLFCALEFIKYGYTPVIVERGCAVEDRIKDVERFISTDKLNSESNIQFGEGGAGTFSDGKLNTGISSAFRKNALQTFVDFGAPEDILYDSHPHIGTDVLRSVVINIRKYIENNGGKYMFNTKLTDLVIKDSRVVGGIISQNGKRSTLPCDCIILAIGHSARDTFEMLKNRNIAMMQKNFAVGVRIEHLRKTIDKGRYGDFYNHPALEAASYNLSTKVNGEGLFTFCMCPGGEVVSATSVENRVVTNGMSYRARDGINSNSALLVGVSTEDFGSNDVLAGMYYQDRIEKAAYEYSGSYKAPCQRLDDFMNDVASKGFKSVMPTYQNGVVAGEISSCLPDKITDVIRAGIPFMARQMPGFDCGDALLTAPETRSSSPVRIIRDDSCESSIKGLYPCGEGAGYAGGITSSAVDGIKVARAVMLKK